jgi:Mono-functional DNA-alkylating methyl methanesulfonate N-term
MHCRGFVQVGDPLIDSWAPIHDCLTLPAFPGAPYDAMVSIAGTLTSSSISRSIVGGSLRISSTFLPEAAAATHVLPLRPCPGSPGLLDASYTLLQGGVCACMATGKGWQSRLWCCSQNSETLEPCWLPGFKEDEQTLNVALISHDRLVQVTGSGVYVIDACSSQGVCCAWQPDGGAIITAGYMAQPDDCSTPQHLLAVADSTLICLSLQPDALLKVVQTKQQHPGITGGSVLNLQGVHAVNGGHNEVAVVGMWSATPSFSLLRIPDLSEGSQPATVTDLPSIAVAFAVLQRSDGWSLLLGLLNGVVCLYQMCPRARSGFWTLDLVETVRVGSTHVRLAHPWSPPGVLSHPNAVLAVAGLHASAFYLPAHSSYAAVRQPTQTTQIEESIMTAPVAIPVGSDITDACGIAAGRIVWADVRSGVVIGDLELDLTLQKHVVPLTGVPRSIAYCSSIRAIACHVRILQCPQVCVSMCCPEFCL